MVKYTIILDEPDNELLEKLSEIEGKAKSRIIREALRLYALLKILTRDPNKLKELLH